METEGIDQLELPAGAPPVMPWRQFADWIRMEQDHETVLGWIKRGYLPTVRIGKHRLINVALLIRQLEEKEI